MSIKKMLIIFGVVIFIGIAMILFTSIVTKGSVSEGEASTLATNFASDYEYTVNSDPVQFGTAIAEIGDNMPASKEDVNLVLSTYDAAFAEIQPQLQADEIYTLLLFSNDLNDYKSGKNENALYRKDAALSIIEKYGIIKTDENGNVISNEAVETPENDAAATTVDEEGNTVAVTEEDVLATDLSKITVDDTIYGNIVTIIETGSGLNMVDDSDIIWENTTGINGLNLGENYYAEDINGVRACYQYTGDDANLEFNTVHEVDDEGTVLNNDNGEYAVYDDYSDCLRNNKAISREFTNGYSTDEDNGKGQADGTIDDNEVSETVLVKEGQYVNVYNVKAALKNYTTVEE